MDGRNWLVSNMPEPLHDIVELYQNNRHLPSFSYAIKELLETHPELTRLMNAVYAGGVEHLEN